MLEIIGVSQLNYSVQYIHIRDKKILRAWPFRPPFSAFRQGAGGRGQGGLSSIIKLRMKVYVCMYFYVLYNVHTLHTIVVTSTFQLCETVELL